MICRERRCFKKKAEKGERTQSKSHEETYKHFTQKRVHIPRLVI